MNDQTRITPRPQMREAQRPVELRPAAQVHSYAAPAPAPDTELSGLVRGLAAFNPALQKWQQQEEQEQRTADTTGGSAYAQTVENPREALTGSPIQAPGALPSAVSDTFRSSMREQLAHRAAIVTKDEALKEFNEAKAQPDFDASAWLAEKRRAALAGITDPAGVDIIGRHFSELEATVRAEVRRDTLQRADEVRQATVSQMAADMFTVDMSADRVAESFPRFVEESQRAGYTPKEAAQFLFTQVTAMSNKLGGAPELFDAFDRKDAQGLTLAARNPGLAPQIEQARRQAKAQLDKARQDAADQGNARVLMQLDDDIKQRPETVTAERLVGLMTPHGAVRSPEQAAAFYARAQDAQRQAMATQGLLSNFDSGTLFWLDPSEQGKVMEQRMGGTVQRMVEAVRSGDQAGIQGAASMLLQAHSRSGATVPVGSVARLTKTLVSNLPGPDGASPTFKAAVELYKAMSEEPTYRAMYFTDDTAKVLESYAAAVDGGSDEKAAYVQAYQSVSPAAKAAAEAYTKTPEFKKKLTTEVRKFVEGSSWVPKFLGGNGRPQNVAAVSMAAAEAVRSFRTANPYASDEQAEAYVQQWTSRNFVLDTASGSAVKVPQGLSGPATQEAISAHSQRVMERLKLGDRSDREWSIQYIPTGTEGQYQLVAFNGSATQAIGPVSLQALLSNERARKLFSPEERAEIGRMRLGVRDGNLPYIAPELLAKAEALQALKPEEIKAYRAAAQKQLTERLTAVPQVSFGAPSFEGLQFSSKAGTVDNRLTARVALEFAGSPMFAAGSQHVGLAASLISMGEGVVLQAYEDPAAGAGKNIGMGYNLKANTGRVSADLKAAGVPQERIADVVQGRAQLTQEQAKRLLQVAMPRYEKQVQEVAEANSPGLWARMTPAQKAVMIDVAWQTGTPEKFRKAWAAIAANDPKALQEETRVDFTDRSGERREDKRRNNLRANMLAGSAQWEALVSRFASLPGSKAQAAAFTAAQ